MLLGTLVVPTKMANFLVIALYRRFVLIHSETTGLKSFAWMPLGMPSASLLPSLLFFLIFRVFLYYFREYIGMGHLQVLPQVRWEFPFNLVPAYFADIIVR